MLKKYKYVLFDLDGTIIDSGKSIIAATEYALGKMSKPVPDIGVLRKFIGPPLIESFMRYTGMTHAEAERAMAEYRFYYNDMGGIFDCEVYSGVEEMFKALLAEGKTLAVATTKPITPSLRILEHFGLDKYFAFVAGDTDDCTRSAKSDVIAYCLESLGSPCHDEVVMVGDREYDIIGARQNGVDSVGVLYGFGSEEELRGAGATYIAERPRDVVNIGE